MKHIWGFFSRWKVLAILAVFLVLFKFNAHSSQLVATSEQQSGQVQRATANDYPYNFTDLAKKGASDLVIAALVLATFLLIPVAIIQGFPRLSFIIVIIAALAFLAESWQASKSGAKSLTTHPHENIA